MSKKFSLSLFIALFSIMRAAGQQFKIKPPHFTVFNHPHYFARVKYQVIPPKILNVILIHQVLGCSTVFFPICFVGKACLNVFHEAFCLYGQTIQAEIFQFGEVVAIKIFKSQRCAPFK